VWGEKGVGEGVGREGCRGGCRGVEGVGEWRV